MSSMVLELQQEVLKSDCDILNALRKAHLIAVKLRLKEFDEWVQHELNGYSQDDQSSIPDYRKVQGQLKAFKPYRGWIPVQFNNDKVEECICEPKLWESLGSLLSVYEQQNEKGYFHLSFTAETLTYLLAKFKSPSQFQYALFFNTYCLKEIKNAVQNCLLEWTLKLESEGILGENMQFSPEEKDQAKNIPQQVNIYLGTVVNGEVKDSQVISGCHHTISFNYEQAEGVLEKVKEAVKAESLSDDDRETADELIAEAETKIAEEKKPDIVKAGLSALKDFLVGAGANVAGAMILEYLQKI